MDEEARKIREELKGLGRGRTTRIPDDLRDAIGVYARRQRHRGASWPEVGELLGLSGATVRRIAREVKGAPRGRRALVPVTVRSVKKEERSERALSLVVPNGLRVEGLDVDDTARLIRALSS